MRKIITLIVFCCFVFGLSAQTKDTIASLIAPLSGKKRIEKLNELAEKVINSDPKRTKVLAYEALKLSKSINYFKGTSDAYHKIGMYYYYNDNYDSTLYFYNKSLALAKQINNKQLIAQALSWTGALYRIQNEFEKAEVHLNEAMKYANEINDYTRLVYCYRNLGEIERVQQNGGKAIAYFDKAEKIAEKIKDKNQQAYIVGAIGEVYRQQSDFALALKYLNKSVDIAKELNNKSLVSNNYYSIGEIYLSNSDFNKALDYLEMALKPAKELNDNIRIADVYASIGDVYKNQGDVQKAEEYYKNALAISTQISYLYTKSYCYSALGELKQGEQQYDLAMEYFNRSLTIAKSINDNWRTADCMNMIGDLYTIRLNYAKAEETLLEGLSIARLAENKATEGAILTSLADLYLKQKDYYKAKKYAKESLAIANQINLASNKKSVSESLYKIYEKLGDYSKAFQYHVMYKDLSDSIRREEVAKKLVQQQMQMEFNEKKAITEIEQAKKDALNEAELHKQQVYTIISIVGLLLMLVLAVFIFRSQRKEKLANILLGKQKQLIEHQKQEITDSINYSKRIQTAILPHDDQIEKYLPQSFFLYKPKDIVSGDFYFLGVPRKKKGEEYSALYPVVVAAADCTGHGVPGALMSVISYQNLNEVSRNYSEPKYMLRKLNYRIKVALKQSDDNKSTRDGLDIALASITYTSENQAEIKFAMANRPVYIFKDSEFIELKPTKHAIGGYTERKQEFEQHEMILSKGDVFYLCTDGYADQFGGDRNKKFTTSRFKELLKSIHHLSIEQQKIELEENILSWKGENEQLDDILVIGILI
jgi:tetratricopeptide (TPR) repeat protein